MNQTQIPFIGLLKADQDFPKTVHPRMAGFHNPPPCSMTRNRGLFLSLLATGADVGSVASLFHRLAGLCAVKGLVSTQMLRFFRCGFRAIGHNTVQDRFHLSDIMTVGSGYNDGERGTSTVHQDVSLRSLFFPAPSDWLRRTPVREELSSLHHPCFASPRQSPANRHNPSNRLARVQRKIQFAPIPRSTGERRSDNRIALAAGPSTDNLSAVHIRCLQTPAGMATACARHRRPVCIPCWDLEKAVESKARLSPTKRRILPMIEFCPLHTSGYRVPEVTCIKKHEMSRAFSPRSARSFHNVSHFIMDQLVYG